MSEKAKTKAATAVPTNGNGDSHDSPLVQSFKAARRVSTPLVAVETPDPAATIITLRRAMPDKTPTLAWDIARGLRGLNEPGKQAFVTLGLPVDQDGIAGINPTETLLHIDKLPQDSVVFMHNLHLQIKEPGVIQGLWNLRDTFKIDKRMVVGLGPSFSLPTELAGDVIVLDEPLPTRAELNAVLDQQYKNVNEALTYAGQPTLPAPDDATRAASLDAVVGLAAYTSEQVIAMALEKKGINIGKLWERKIKAIQNTRGLNVYKALPNDTTLDELKGIDNVVAFARELIAAEAFNLIVFLDEMDKSFAGGMSEHTGDSGVAKDQVGQVLTYMNDNKSLGLLAAGVAGTGKSQLPKAMGAASGKPVVIMDMGGAKGIHVGESEMYIRNMLKVITATAEGRVLFIGTANRTTIFTPEMNRRFLDQYFFDVLSDEGRKALWPIYVAKNGLTASQAAIPQGFDAGWTGAEIQRACERAALFGKSVVEVGKNLIPQAVSAKKVIAQMRADSAGKFLSASYAGLYEIPQAEPTPMIVRTQRSIEVN